MKDSFWICFWLAMIVFTQKPIIDLREPRLIEMLDHALRKIAAPQPAMRPKRLEWLDGWARCAFGTYHCHENRLGLFLPLTHAHANFGEFDTESKAKAAAQADYDKRAMACFEPGEQPAEVQSETVSRINEYLGPAPNKPAQAPDGWQLVPVEPTHRMLLAGMRAETDREQWRAMLAAAPAPGGNQS